MGVHVTTKNLREGARVVRGAGWNPHNGDQDGGILGIAEGGSRGGRLGTIIWWNDGFGVEYGSTPPVLDEDDPPLEKKERVVVRWDHDGSKVGYSLGTHGVFDLKFADIVAIPDLPPAKAKTKAKLWQQSVTKPGEVATRMTASVGSRVERGPDWHHGNQDGGKPGNLGTIVAVATSFRMWEMEQSKQSTADPANPAGGNDSPPPVSKPKSRPPQHPPQPPVYSGEHMGLAVVKWDFNGYESDYRIGHEGCFDLKFVSTDYSPRLEITTA